MKRAQIMNLIVFLCRMATVMVVLNQIEWRKRSSGMIEICQIHPSPRMNEVRNFQSPIHSRNSEENYDILILLPKERGPVQHKTYSAFHSHHIANLNTSRSCYTWLILLPKSDGETVNTPHTASLYLIISDNTYIYVCKQICNPKISVTSSAHRESDKPFMAL